MGKDVKLLTDAEIDNAIEEKSGKDWSPKKVDVQANLSKSGSGVC